MRAAVVDCDQMAGGTRHPNLALMKISTWLRGRGLDAELVTDPGADLSGYGLVCASKVFTSSPDPPCLTRLWPVPRDHADQVGDALLEALGGGPALAAGGTGWFPDGDGPRLSPECEHSWPDYHLYDAWIASEEARGIKPSRFNDYRRSFVGFATRGCFRKCPFCVNRVWDRAVRWALVSEFCDRSREPGRDTVDLWDDNLLACAAWREVIDEVRATGLRVSFRQGLDVRLLTDEKAAALASLRWSGDTIFAFDDLRDRDAVLRGLETWRRHSGRQTKVYLLCGFGPWAEGREGSDADVLNDIRGLFARMRDIFRLGCLPYVMRHAGCRASKWAPVYNSLARWANQPGMVRNLSYAEWTDVDARCNGTSAISCKRVMALLEREAPDLGEELHVRRDGTRDALGRGGDGGRGTLDGWGLTGA